MMQTVGDFKIVERGLEPARCCYNCAHGSKPFRNEYGFAVPATRRCAIDGGAKDIEWTCSDHVRRGKS